VGCYRRHPFSYCYGPIVQGRLLTHHSGGRHDDEEGLRWWFPLRQGAGKSFWTLPISHGRRRRLAVCFLEKCSFFRVFSMEGINRQKGDVRRWTRRSHHLVARPRGGLRHHMVWLPLGPRPALLWTLSSCQVIRNFSFCFVQFREYFLSNFPETQK
jgi:hypothetical protein